MRRALIAVAVVGLFGCGPTTPEQPPNVSAFAQSTMKWRIIARSNAPAVTIVFDNSATMRAAYDPSDAACPAGCGAASPCPSGCRTNFEAARDSLQAMLAMHGAEIRWGLAATPELGCGGPRIGLAPISLIEADDPRAAARTSEAISVALDQLAPSAQAPLAEALRAAAAVPTMNELNSKQAILLVTAGRDRCTPGAPDCAAACDTPSELQSAIEQARARGIETEVLGVGAVLGAEADELNALARAGGAFARFCLSSNDCGDSACGADHHCARAFLRLDELSTPFTPVIAVPESPCDFTLGESPQRPEWMTVRANGQLLAPGTDTWTFDTSSASIHLEGATCEQALQSTLRHPFELEVRILNEVH